MNLRDLLALVEAQGWLRRVGAPVDPHLELSALIHALGEEVTLFSAVRGWPGPVVAGLCSRRHTLALALGVPEEQLLSTLVQALRRPIAPPVVQNAPCQQHVSEDVDLSSLPILTHFAQDGGPYITAGVAVIDVPGLGRNVAYHRLMQIGPRQFTARLVEGRGTHTAWAQAEGDLPMAVCLGAPLHVQLAASMSPAPGVDELAIAHALAPTPTVRAVGLPLEVPADCEIVLEGRLTHELGPEGPFVDLTRTSDYVRAQPIFEVDRITHREAPIYQALLPGGLEHKLLMGMPREPTIYDAVSQVCDCRNVCITPGGGYWLHAVVQIAKRAPDDGRAAIAAAFRGHSSLKHVVVVDEDVNPFAAEQVEWALATRFQAARDLVLLEDQPSSSLDPSAQHVPGAKARTSKLGLDATIHWASPGGAARDAYEVVPYPEVDLKRVLGEPGVAP